MPYEDSSLNALANRVRNLEVKLKIAYGVAACLAISGAFVGQKLQATSNQANNLSQQVSRLRLESQQISDDAYAAAARRFRSDAQAVLDDFHDKQFKAWLTDERLQREKQRIGGAYEVSFDHTQDVVNPLTGGITCPINFHPHKIARLLTPEPQGRNMGADLFLCLHQNN